MTGELQQAWPYRCCDHCACGEPDGLWAVRAGHDEPCESGCHVLRIPAHRPASES